jgi:hypothetical protein
LLEAVVTHDNTVQLDGRFLLRMQGRGEE